MLVLNPTHPTILGSLAQLVEQQPLKLKVMSSILIGSTTIIIAPKIGFITAFLCRSPVIKDCSIQSGAAGRQRF
jgi:hypothetical protein